MRVRTRAYVLRECIVPFLYSTALHQRNRVTSYLDISRASRASSSSPELVNVCHSSIGELSSRFSSERHLRRFPSAFFLQTRPTLCRTKNCDTDREARSFIICSLHELDIRQKLGFGIARYIDFCPKSSRFTYVRMHT